MAELIELSYFAQDLSPQYDPSRNLWFLMAATGWSLPLYFALKNKHGYRLANRSDFVAQVTSLVGAFSRDYASLVIPQSRSTFIEEVAQGCQKPVHQLRKRSKADICERALALATWSRLERESQARAWAEMGKDFAINVIKSNQRHHYVAHLFEPLKELRAEARTLILDDFVMSGNTLAAMKSVMSTDSDSPGKGAGADVFAVFYQQAYRGGLVPFVR